MKICIAQTNPHKGNIEKNIEQHVKLIHQAINRNANLIIFPELSLTGYEPQLAKDLATTQEDKRLDQLQELSNRYQIVIGAGLPTKENDDIYISTIIFQPNQARVTYSKQYLYHTEIGHFTAGKKPLYLNIEGQIIAPAICYELSNPEHSKGAAHNNAAFYIASVLNSVEGVNGDHQKLAAIARQYKMTVFMANYIGVSGGYQCAGKSSVWNHEGEIIEQLSDKNEGLLVYDTSTQNIESVVL